MVHRGEILRKAIDKSDFNVSEVCKMSGIPRQTLYGAFLQKNPSLEYFIKVGKAIGHDFSNEIPELVSGFTSMVSENSTEYVKGDENIAWMHKYYELLEKYVALVEKVNKGT